MDAPVYRVKGCPYCGAKPILQMEGEGKESALNNPQVLELARGFAD
ncbi:hypothetical protein ACFIQG_22165 [Comamonas odontotermitis]